MNGPGADIPSRRVEDHGTRRGRLLAKWRRWKDVVIAAVLLPTAALTIWASLEIRSQSAATAHAAKVSCQRARAFGPGVANDYERRGVFTAEKLASYRRSIPTVCPKWLEPVASPRPLLAGATGHKELVVVTEEAVTAAVPRVAIGEGAVAEPARVVGDVDHVAPRVLADVAAAAVLDDAVGVEPAAVTGAAHERSFG